MIYKLEDKLLAWVRRNWLTLCGAALLVLSLFQRYRVLSMASIDALGCLLPWFEEIIAGGRLASLDRLIGNYNMAYQTILTLLTYVPGDPLTLIKLPSVVCDYALAFVGALIVRDICPEAKKKLMGFITFFTLINLPTVFMNSAMWGQCDTVYTTIILIGYYLLRKDKANWAMFVFGVAVSFKIQTAFVVPALLFLYIYEKKHSVLSFFLIPVGYVVPCVPALLSGRPISQLWTIYTEQVELYKSLTLNYPNLYSWLPNDYDLFGKMGIMLTLSALIFFFLAALQKIKSGELSETKRLLLFAITVHICVFFLPSMHERYGFVMEIFLVLYAIASKRLVWQAAAMVIHASLAYMPFLLNYHPLDPRILSALNFVILATSLKEFFSSCAAVKADGAGVEAEKRA